VDGGEGITSFALPLHPSGIRSAVIYFFFLDTASVTNQKTRASLEIEIKLISANTHHEEKSGCTFIEREIKCGDKKWSKKEIANKDINKISFGQQGHAQTTAIRSNQKSTNIQSEGADVAICYIANHTNWSSKCMYAMKRGGFERESEFGDREYMELNTAENTRKHKRKTITE